ncbi:unnamed protein product [Heterobilharzia americana]|nr:unnamed protein product [Heterobilharzia americana]
MQSKPQWKTDIRPLNLAKLEEAVSDLKQGRRWDIITWQLPSLPNQPKTLHDEHVSTEDNSKREGNRQFNEADEEDILREGEDIQLSITPYPPQLMPVFIPTSLEDGYARLTLISNSSARFFVRICDHIVAFQNYSPNNPNVTLSEMLLRGIKRHRQQAAALEAVPESPTTSSPESPLPTIYGLPSNWPTKVDLRQSLNSREFLQRMLLTTPLISPVITQRLAPVSCPDLVAHLELIHRTCRRRWAIKRIEESLSDSQLQLNTEYTGRLHVLKELGFIDSATQTGCLSLKGRIACELTKMEVLVTQLLLDGSFTDLSPPDLAAVLSCFVFDARGSDMNAEQQQDAQYLQSLLDSLRYSVDSSQNVSYASSYSNPIVTYPPHLVPTLEKIVLSAIKLEELQTKHGLADPSTDARVSFQVVNAVYGWAQGYSFSSLVSMTSVPEGHLIRGFLQLDELLRHICSACHHLGDKNLSLRMTEARNAILRDLVCAPSLYVADDLL